MSGALLSPAARPARRPCETATDATGAVWPRWKHGALHAEAGRRRMDASVRSAEPDTRNVPSADMRRQVIVLLCTSRASPGCAPHKRRKRRTPNTTCRVQTTIVAGAAEFMG